LVSIPFRGPISPYLTCTSSRILAIHDMFLLAWWSWLCPTFLSVHCHHRALLQSSQRLRNWHCCHRWGIRRHSLSSHHPTRHAFHQLPLVDEADSLDLSYSLRFRDRLYATTPGTRPNRERLAKPAHSSSPGIFPDSIRGLSARIRAICTADVYNFLLQVNGLLIFGFLCGAAGIECWICVWTLSSWVFR